MEFDHTHSCLSCGKNWGCPNVSAECFVVPQEGFCLVCIDGLINIHADVQVQAAVKRIMDAKIVEEETNGTGSL